MLAEAPDMDVPGFEADQRVAAMISRVRRLSPNRPLVFGPIDPRHHANGGAEIFSRDLRVSLRPDKITNELLSHELAHIIIGLEHDHLGISDHIPRGTPDRRMIGTVLSMFEHPAVFALQGEYGFDTHADAEQTMAEYSADLDRLPLEPPTGNVYIEKMQGYVELRYLRPDDARWPSIDRRFAERAPRSYGSARELLGVVTPERVRRHAYREMLDAFVEALGLRKAYWPPLVLQRPAARSDR